MEIIKGIQAEPYTISLHGAAGAGKSTIASKFKNSLMFDFEGGVSRINADKTPRIKSLKEFSEALKWFVKSDYECAIIDGFSAFEEMLIAEVLTDHGNKYKSVAQIPYGQGGEALKAYHLIWIEKILSLKNYGKSSVIIFHEAIETYQNPSGENYDRFVPAIHKKALNAVVAKLDALFYMTYEKLTTELESGKVIGKSTGRRIIIAEEKPWAMAKNRFGIEDKILVNTEEEQAEFIRRIK